MENPSSPLGSLHSIYYPTLKSTSSQLSLSGCHSHSLTSTSLCYTVLQQSMFWSHGGAGTLQLGWVGLIRRMSNSTIQKHVSNCTHTFTSLACLFTAKDSSKSRIKDISYVPPEQIQIHSFLGHPHRETMTSLTWRAFAHSFEGWF